MFIATIPSRAGGQAQSYIRLRLQLNEIPRTHGACFHEVLMRILGEPCQHEDVHDIMYLHLSHRQTQTKVISRSPSEV